MGTIPAEFSGVGGVLAIGGRSVTKLYGDGQAPPLFVYDLAIVRARIDRFRRAMPDRLGLHYAVKANPFPPLVEALAPKTSPAHPEPVEGCFEPPGNTLRQAQGERAGGIRGGEGREHRVDGLDIASAGELALALAAGAPAERISFAGPGKRDAELRDAIAAGVTINLESEGEARRALALADRLGIRPSLAVRVNPEFALRGSGMKMGGAATPFGVDAERAGALVREVVAAGADYRGLHIFAGSQALDSRALIEAQAATLALAARLSDEAGAAPPLVNLGGGFGIPYFPGEVPLDIEAIGGALAERMAALPDILAKSAFALELGRWLVGEAGVYLARIVDRKESRGETFLVTDGGLHHQLAASGNFGTVVRRNYPAAIATRFGAAPEEIASIVGCLCTPLDRLADRVALPRAAPGDLVALFMAGAYGATASPQAFLGHPPPREMIVNG